MLLKPSSKNLSFMEIYGGGIVSGCVCVALKCTHSLKYTFRYSLLHLNLDGQTNKTLKE